MTLSRVLKILLSVTVIVLIAIFVRCRCFPRSQGPCLPAKTEAMKCPTLCPPTERSIRVAIGEPCPGSKTWNVTSRDSTTARYCHYSLDPSVLSARLQEQSPRFAPVFSEQLSGHSRDSQLAKFNEIDRASLYAAAELDAPAGSEPDCLVVPASASAIEADFKAAGNVATAFTIARPASHDVRVAVVDNSPRNPIAGELEGAHGRAMRGIIEHFACPTTECHVEVLSYRGLPRRYDTDGSIREALDSEGGQFGFQSDVARAVDEAIAHWNTAIPRPGQLIINLSLGWEPGCPGNSDVLLQSLKNAAQQGALILAAAGNRPAGTCASGPTGPGNWLQETVTDPAGNTLPLLYTITALDADGGRLASFREGSNTPYAARGYSAAISDGLGTYGPMSGSSVATAIASGTAARTWSILATGSPTSTIPAAEVMALLHRDGDPTGRTADLYHPSSSYAGPSTTPPQQRAINTCEAVKTACQTAGTCTATCSAPPLPDASGVGDAIASEFASATAVVAPDSTKVAQSCHWCATTVATTTVVGEGSGPALPNPWAIPQPGDTACSICGLSGNKLYVLLANYPKTMTSLLSTTLSFVADDGTTVVRQYDTTALPAVPNVPYILQDDELTALTALPGMRASIHTTFGDASGNNQVSFSETLPILKTLPPGTP